MSTVGMIRVPTNRLIDDGLMFEINRQVLHPLGLALAVLVDPASQSPETIVLMETNDDEGVLYDEKDFAGGAAKFASYMRREGEARITKRVAALKYVRQTRSDQ